MLPRLELGLADEDEEVRGNSAFAVGVLCKYAGLAVDHARILRLLKRFCLADGVDVSL